MITTLRVLRDFWNISTFMATGWWTAMWASDQPYTLYIWAWALPSIVLYCAFSIAYEWATLPLEYRKKSEA